MAFQNMRMKVELQRFNYFLVYMQDQKWQNNGCTDTVDGMTVLLLNCSFTITEVFSGLCQLTFWPWQSNKPVFMPLVWIDLPGLEKWRKFLCFRWGFGKGIVRRKI